jgi:hypothetical protein
MDVFWWLAIIAWTAVVSFTAAFIIKRKPAAVVMAVCASVIIPLALGIVVTSFIPIASFGPEEFLQRCWYIIVGAGAVRLPLNLLCLFAGTALGLVAAHFVVRLRRRR